MSRSSFRRESVRARRTAAATARLTLESLESRRLLAGDFNAGVALPYHLEFQKNHGGILDRDGMGTGFTYVQPNINGTELNTRKLDLKVGVSILRLYSVGTNFEAANTLQNALMVRYSASTKPWVMGTRINGTLPQVDADGEEGGILFGPDQDNYAKLVVTHNSSGTGLMFLDEEKTGSTFTHLLPQTVTNIGSLASVQTLDLFFSANPVAGTLTALYRVNGGAVLQMPHVLTLTGAKKDLFFSPAGFGGIMAAQGAPTTGVDITFEQFFIKRGSLTADVAPIGNPSISARKIFNDVRGGSGQTIGTSVRNTGTGSLTVTSLSITGPDASQFTVSPTKSVPITLAPGDALPLKITYSASSSTSLGVHTATLTVRTAEGKTRTVALRGLATAGTGGTNEPSLQRVLDLYQIPDNVGDADPNDVYIGDPPSKPNDEVTIQELKKAGTGPVTIQMLASFGVSSNPTARVGYYEPGSPTSKVNLFSIPQSDGQSVNVVPTGITSFDPGTAAFAFYSEWPGFKDNGQTRVVYQEDGLNTFDTHQPRHIRWYPMKNADGSVVPNTYIMAHEDFPGGYDTQDVVAIVSNVTIAQTAGPEIGAENLDEPPNTDRMVFTRFISGDPNFPNTTNHDTAKVRIHNTGTSTLAISSISISGPFQLLTSAGAQTIPAGKFADVGVKFVGTSTAGVESGALTVNSSDADEPARAIALVGYNQKIPEGNSEAPLATMMNSVFGYPIVFQGPGQHLTNGGKLEAVGDEVLSPYWLRAGTNEPVTVRQLSAFHTQGNTALFRWFTKGSTTMNNLFTTAAVDAQRVFPRQEGNLCAAAGGSFTPSSSPFGFRVDNEWSDDSKNQIPAGSTTDQGHHVRFFPLKDSHGNAVPNTYLMVMDYQGINYDYNDNTYIISNIKPASGATSGAAPQSLAVSPPATTSSAIFASAAIPALSPSDLLKDDQGAIV